MTYFRGVSRADSGEISELKQLADAAGGQLVDCVPQDGDLYYQVQTVMDDARQQLHAELPTLRARSGRTLFGLHALVNDSETIEEIRTLQAIGPVVSRSLIAVELFGPRLGDIPCVGMNESAYQASSGVTLNHCIYSGHLWREKQVGQLMMAARMLPDWSFDIHIPNLALPINRCNPLTNVMIDTQRHSDYALKAYLSEYEYVWLPRTESQWLYEGRSSLTALASGNATLVCPDIGVNRHIHPDAAIKYPLLASEEETVESVVEILKSHRRVSREAVQRQLEACRPDVVWKQLRVLFR